MISHLRRNAVAYLALVVALGGTSYAAAKLPRNSVGTVQIRAGAVQSSDVKDGSLRRKDLAAGVLPAAEVHFAAQGSTPFGDPPANPPSTLAETTFDLPAAGRLWVYGSIKATITCSGDNDAEFGLYLDGEPVPGSGRGVLENETAFVSLEGLTAVVPAGSHTVEIGRTCGSGASLAGSSTNYVTGVLLVGS